MIHTNHKISIKAFYFILLRIKVGEYSFFTLGEEVKKIFHDRMIQRVWKVE